MSVAETFLEQQMHPTVIIGAYRQALEDMLKIMKEEIRYLFSQQIIHVHYDKLTSIKISKYKKLLCCRYTEREVPVCATFGVKALCQREICVY